VGNRTRRRLPPRQTARLLAGTLIDMNSLLNIHLAHALNKRGR